MRLFIGNLSYATSQRELIDVFYPYDVGEAKIICDPQTGKSKGCAFVDVADAEKAIADLDGTEVNGRPLRIEAARQR